MAKADFSLSPLSSLKRHSPIASLTFLSVLISAPLASLWLMPREYEASARISVGEKEVGVSTLGQALTDLYSQSPGKAADPVATQAERLKSAKVIEAALKMLRKGDKVPDEKLPSLETVREAMKISIVPATNILQVSLRGSDPEITTLLLNAIIRSAVNESVRSTRADATTLREFLEEQVPKRERKLQQAAAAEAAYRERNGIVSLEDQAKSIVESITTLQEEERKLQGQMQENAVKDGMLRRVTGITSPVKAYQSVRIGQNEKLKEFQKQLNAIEVAIVEGRSRLGDQHPDLLALIQRRNELRSLYQQQFAAVIPATRQVSANEVAAEPIAQEYANRLVDNQLERRAIEDRTKLVRSEVLRLRSQALRLPQMQRTLTALIRERQAEEEAFKLLKGKLEEAKLAEGQILSTMRIVELGTVPDQPISPRPLALIAISAIAGIILAGALVSLLELLDSSLRNAAEAEAVLDLPVLSTLPKLPPTAPTATALQQFLDASDQVEPYRLLLKTLQSMGDSKNKALVVSSVTAGEGKSATVLHLAAVAAMLSRRTLIIDADLRHPIHHRLLNVPAFPGLTEIVNERRSLLEVVRRTSIPNLSIVPFGQVVRRPSALIEASSMPQLLKEAARHYDLVIVDAAPLSLYADAGTLAQSTDGVVVVMQPNVTPRDKAMRAIADLRKSGIVPLGIVMNQTVLSIEKEPPLTNPPPPPNMLPTPVPS